MRIWLDQVREEPFNWDEKEKVAPEELDRPDQVNLFLVAAKAGHSTAGDADALVKFLERATRKN